MLKSVVLIEVPEIGTRTKIDDLLSFITDAFHRLKIGKSIKRTKFSPNWRKIYSGGSQQIKRLKEIAVSRGGSLLSSEWRGGDVALKFRCKEGHKFTIKPSGVFQKAWCQKCAGNELGTLEEMQKIAASRGRKCLSDEYVNGKIKLQWYCTKHDYTWWNLPNNIKKHNQWCNFCAGGSKHTIETVNALANSRGGECLSQHYKNTTTKLKFKCNRCKNVWETSLASILQGSFCPPCGRKRSAKKRSNNIEEIKKIAEIRGGKCLSTKYENSPTPLIFKCGISDHPSWKATPSNIKAGKWCPKCGRLRVGKTRRNSQREVPERHTQGT